MTKSVERGYSPENFDRDKVIKYCEILGLDFNNYIANYFIGKNKVREYLQSCLGGKILKDLTESQKEAYTYLSRSIFIRTDFQIVEMSLGGKFSLKENTDEKK